MTVVALHHPGCCTTQIPNHPFSRVCLAHDCLDFGFGNVERYFYDNGKDPQRHLDGDTIEEEIFWEIR